MIKKTLSEILIERYGNDLYKKSVEFPKNKINIISLKEDPIKIRAVILDNEREYHLIIDDKCVSKDTTTWGDEPEHTGPSSYSRKVLGGEILGEDGERHTVECALYHPIWRERLTKSIIDKIRCTFRLQVHIYVDAKLIYDSFYESEEERICEEREIERIESYRDEMARREGKEPFYTHRGKKYVKRT